MAKPAIGATELLTVARALEAQAVYVRVKDDKPHVTIGKQIGVDPKLIKQLHRQHLVVLGALEPDNLDYDPRGLGSSGGFVQRVRWANPK